jgi:anti-repressor protein
MDLIDISRKPIGGREVDAVNARDLWQFLESKQEFANWIRARIEQCDLVEGQDYLFENSVKEVPSQGGLQRVHIKERFLSVESAKHLCMIERNDKGKQIRKWFIEREIELRSLKAPGVISLDLNNPASILATVTQFAERLANKEAEILKLETVVIEQQPKVEALDLLETATAGSFCLREACKQFAIPERKFIQWLQQHNWIFRQKNVWLAYSDRQKQGFLEHKLTTYPKGEGEEDGMSTQVRITAAGMAHLAKLFARKDAAMAVPSPSPASVSSPAAVQECLS